MKLTELKFSAKCDISGCKNKAVFTLEREGILKRVQTNVCENCLKELYEIFGQQIVPKSPRNMIKKNLEERLGK